MHFVSVETYLLFSWYFAHKKIHRRVCHKLVIILLGQLMKPHTSTRTGKL